jgi:hypothetical protein
MVDYGRVASWGAAGGLVVGLAATIGVAVVLLSGDGATAKTLLVALLLLLPLLAFGACAGCSAALAYAAAGAGVRRLSRWRHPH